MLLDGHMQTVNFKEEAEFYYRQGIPILVDREKRPLVRWQQWQDKPQSLEEFEALPWPKADAFGILTGTRGINACYFCVIDVDRSDFDVSLLPATKMQRTPRGGYHFAYWSECNAKGRKNHSLGVELLGYGNYCRMYPQSRLNNSGATKVPDIGKLFDELVSKLGGSAERENVNIPELLQGIKQGFRDNAAIRLATYFRKKGFDSAQVLQSLTEWNAKNSPPLDSSTIAEKVRSAFNMAEPYKWNFIDDDLEVAKLTTRNLTKMDHVFTPTPASIEYESDSDLYTAIVDFLMKHVDLPAPSYYSVCALFAMATWRVEQATVATYLNLLAPHGSGKSTLQGMMRWLCSKSIHSAGATKGAIIRIVDGTNATLLLDEADNWLQQKDWDNPIMAILNAGYQRGIYALMCEPDLEKKYKVVAKDVFGFKIISGRNPLVDPLASRCITIPMRKTSRTFPKLDLAHASHLRGQLRRYGETHSEPLESEVISKIEEPRLREIMQPLFACTPIDPVKDDLLKFAIEEQNRREESEVASVEAEIARAVIQYGQGLTELSVRAITNAFNEPRTAVKEQWKSSAVGRILQRLGFHARHTRAGNMIQLKPDLIDYLKGRYGKDEETTTQTQSKLEA